MRRAKQQVERGTKRAREREADRETVKEKADREEGMYVVASDTDGFEAEAQHAASIGPLCDNQAFLTYRGPELLS